MKRYIRSSEEIVKRIEDELYAILESNGNGAEVKGIKTRKSYWLHVQETGPGFAIYFDDGNIWRDHSKDRDPIYFSSYKEVAEWLLNN